MGVVAATRLNRSSMLQDVEAGKRTEIDEITGAVVNEARRFGIATPTNETLWRLVKSLGSVRS